MDGGGGGGGDVELVCKTLQFEHKLFYFDLKENPRGRYLKISEKTAANRSTIIVPSEGIRWFLDAFNYFIGTDERDDVSSKELRLDAKMFYFDAGVNKRGRFLKISEASVNRNRSTIIVPAGSSGEEGWEAFRNLLAEINEENSSHFYSPHTNQHMEAAAAVVQERLTGLSDDVGAGFISAHQSGPASELTVVDRMVDLPAHEEIVGGGNLSKVIRVDQKRFFFDLGSNNRGHYLRISEVAGADRSSIILPLSGLRQFNEMIGHFVEVTKERVETMSNANIRSIEPPQR
ncbi:hypothetical protein LUZ60_004033 [Juncus effusus]|nr:hypothetical protein LUZ60_004033 [Juncus effusus]